MIMLLKAKFNAGSVEETEAQGNPAENRLCSCLGQMNCFVRH